MRLDFLKKAKKNEIMAFTAILCAAIVVGYYIFFLSPVISKLAFLFRESYDLNGKISKAEIAVNSMEKIKKEIRELESREDFYSTKLPKEEEFSAILENLSGMAKHTRVKITKIQPRKETRGSLEELSETPRICSRRSILINAQCGYHQLGAFIMELENAERFMEISDIKIDAGTVNPKRHDVQLIVSAYILKGEE